MYTYDNRGGILIKRLWQMCKGQVATDTVLDAVNSARQISEQAAELERVCECWLTMPSFTADHFTFAALYADHNIALLVSSVERHDENSARELLRRYNKARENVLKVFGAIEALRVAGYSDSDHVPLQRKQAVYTNLAYSANIRPAP